MRWCPLLYVVWLAVASTGCGKIGDLILGKPEEPPAPVEAPVSSAPIPDSSVGPVQAPDMALPQGESVLPPLPMSTDTETPAVPVQPATVMASGEQPVPTSTPPSVRGTVPPVWGWLGKVLDRKVATTPRDREIAEAPRETRPPSLGPVVRPLTSPDTTKEIHTRKDTRTPDALGGLPRVETRAAGADAPRTPPLEMRAESAGVPLARVPATPRDDAESAATPRAPDTVHTPVTPETRHQTTTDRAAAPVPETRVVVPIPWLMGRPSQPASTPQRAIAPVVDHVAQSPVRGDAPSVRDADVARTADTPARAEPAAPAPRADTRVVAEVPRDTAERAAATPLAAPTARETERTAVAPADGVRAVDTAADLRTGTESGSAVTPREAVTHEALAPVPRDATVSEHAAADMATHDTGTGATHEEIPAVPRDATAPEHATVEIMTHAEPAVPRDEPAAAHVDTETTTHAEPVAAVHGQAETATETTTHDEPVAAVHAQTETATETTTHAEPVAAVHEQAETATETTTHAEPVAAVHEQTETVPEPAGHVDPSHDQTEAVHDTSSDVVVTFDTDPVPQPEPAPVIAPVLTPAPVSEPAPEPAAPLGAAEEPPLPKATEAVLQCAAPWLFPSAVTPGLLPDPKHIKIPLMHPEMLAEKFVSTMFAVGVENGLQFGLYSSYQYELQQQQLQAQGPLLPSGLGQSGAGKNGAVPGGAGPVPPGGLAPTVLASMFNRGAYFKQMLQEDYGVTVAQLEQRQLRQLASLGFNVADVSCSTKLKHKDTVLKYGMQLQCIDHVGGMYLDDGKNGPINIESAKKAMQVWLDGYVKPNATHPGILAWRVYDEPNATADNGIPGFLKDTLTPNFYAADPLHPVTVLTNSGFANIAQLMELYYGEVYELYGAMSTGNEDYGQSIAAIRATAATAPLINAFTLWTVDTGSYNVQPADIRKQAFLTLANGGNGFMWFSGSLQPPQWLRWPMEEGLGYNYTQGKQHGQFFDVESEELVEIAGLNDRLVPLGHLLVGATWLAAHPFQVASCPYTYLGSYSTAGVKYAQKEAGSVQVGVWDTGTAFVLVVYNSNIKQAEVGTVRGPGFPASYHLYDLHTLQDLGAVLDDGYTVALAPGDGHLFLVAEPAIFAAEKTVIHAKRYAFLSQRLNARLEELQHTPVDLAPVKSLVQQAQAAYDTQQYAPAVPLLEQAEEVLQLQVANHPVMGPLTQSLQEARSLFGQINEWLRAKLPIIAQPLKPGEPLGGDMQQLGTGHPGLQKIIDEQLRPVSKKYYPLVLGLEQPAAPTAKPADFAALVDELQATYAALQAWVPGGAAGAETVPTLGVITLVADDTENPAWLYASQNIPGAARLVLTGPGQFKKAGGVKPANLDGFDLLWLHYVQPTGGDFLDTEQRVQAPADLLAADTASVLMAYAKTHGLLLSGYATYLVHRWGLEPNAPNVLDQGTTGAFVSIYSAGQVANDQNLGVRVAPQFAAHPLYQDLDKDAIWLRGEAVYRERHRFAWQYDPAQPATSFPKHGYILGGATYAIQPPPDTHYDVVEYPQSEGGKILLVGLPFFDFDPAMNVGTHHVDEYATLLHWMQNTLQYLGTTGTAVGKGKTPGVQPPVYHMDFAKLEENPLLSWKINGNPTTSPKPVFDKNLDNQWERWFSGEQGPLTLEVDLGRSAIINQVAVYNAWVSNQYAAVIGKMTLQVKDAQGQCVDPPGGPFQFYGNGTQGLTFYLPPVQTTGVCFVDMYSAEVEGNPKQASSIGAQEVRIYGALPEAAVENDTHDATEEPHAPTGGAE